MSADLLSEAAVIAEGGHTAGPWTIRYAAGRPYAVMGAAATAARLDRPELAAGVVAWGGIMRRASAEGAANARLIAAAPQMLEALLAAEDKHRLGILNMTDAEIERVTTLRRAAITLATSPRDERAGGGA